MNDNHNVLNLPQEFELPDYAGGTIGNVPTAVANMLGVPLKGLPPLNEPLWKPVANGVKRVVMLTIDAWGWNLMQRDRNALRPWIDRADISAQITSIFPSTTVAALSSLWTGTAPAQHGLVGLRLFMPAYGTLTQFIKFTPTFGSFPDALVEAGLDPETFLERPGFGEQLTEAGIESHAFKGREIIDSALSKMHGRGVTGNHGATTAVDMFVQMRRLLEQNPGKPMYLSAYWPTVDTLSHIYGWDHEVVAAEVCSIWRDCTAEFLDKLSPAARKDTVFFVLADHGQVVTPPEQQVYLSDHHELEKMLLMRPAGEPRTLYLYARHGRLPDIINYINTHLSHAMVPILADEALAAGLLGPQPHARDTAVRVGDVVVIMRDGYVFLTEKERKKAAKMIGRHGGMTKAEMQVPWLGFHLEGW